MSTTHITAAQLASPKLYLRQHLAVNIILPASSFQARFLSCGNSKTDCTSMVSLIESMMSDVGDQILLLPYELHAKPGQKIPTEKEIKAAYKKAHPRA